MDFNFPLVLAILVFVSGLIWLLDILILAPRRRAEPAGQEPVGQEVREPIYVEYSKSFFPVLLIVFILQSISRGHAVNTSPYV